MGRPDRAAALYGAIKAISDRLDLFIRRSALKSAITVDLSTVTPVRLSNCPGNQGRYRGSFVPPAPIRELRDLTRYRKSQLQERVREVNRLHKVLEDTGVKLAVVASDVLGVSGRAMLEALLRGTTDPKLLAELSRGKMRKKIPELRRALRGRFGSHHQFLVGRILAHLDYLDEAIEECGHHIKELLHPFAQVVEQHPTHRANQRALAGTNGGPVSVPGSFRRLLPTPRRAQFFHVVSRSPSRDVRYPSVGADRRK